MKRMVSFDSYEASAYDVVDALYPFKNFAGVKSVDVLSAVEGSPKFCIIVDIEDERDAAFVERIEQVKKEYSGYYSNLTNRAFKKVG